MHADFCRYSMFVVPKLQFCFWYSPVLCTIGICLNRAFAVCIQCYEMEPGPTTPSMEWCTTKQCCFLYAFLCNEPSTKCSSLYVPNKAVLFHVCSLVLWTLVRPLPKYMAPAKQCCFSNAVLCSGSWTGPIQHLCKQSSVAVSHAVHTYALDSGSAAYTCMAPINQHCFLYAVLHRGPCNSVLQCLCRQSSVAALDPVYTYAMESARAAHNT